MRLPYPESTVFDLNFPYWFHLVPRDKKACQNTCLEHVGMTVTGFSSMKSRSNPITTPQAEESGLDIRAVVSRMIHMSIKLLSRYKLR